MLIEKIPPLLLVCLVSCSILPLISAEIDGHQAAQPAPEVGAADEKLRIYGKIFALKPEESGDSLTSEQLVKLLHRVQELEEASPNGGRTTLELDLIKLADVKEELCSEPYVFPRISWLKRRFSMAPNVFNYLLEIEKKLLHQCRWSFEGDFALATAQVKPETKRLIAELRKVIGSMGVNLIAD